MQTCQRKGRMEQVHQKLFAISFLITFKIIIGLTCSREKHGKQSHDNYKAVKNQDFTMNKENSPDKQTVLNTECAKTGHQAQGMHVYSMPSGQILQTSRHDKTQ